jgi:hypothetical protein
MTMYKPGMAVTVTTVTGAVSVQLLSRLGPSDWLALDVGNRLWLVSLDPFSGWRKSGGE